MLDILIPGQGNTAIFQFLFLARFCLSGFFFPVVCILLYILLFTLLKFHSVLTAFQLDLLHESHLAGILSHFLNYSYYPAFCACNSTKKKRVVPRREQRPQHKVTPPSSPPPPPTPFPGDLSTSHGSIHKRQHGCAQRVCVCGGRVSGRQGGGCLP